MPNTNTNNLYKTYKLLFYERKTFLKMFITFSGL